MNQDMRWVPAEATEEMLDATKGPGMSPVSWDRWTKKRHAKLYRQMVSAAPRQPGEVGAGMDQTIQLHDQGLDGIDHGRHFSGGNQELPSETVARIKVVSTQPLGEPFTSVLYDNLPKLYVEDASAQQDEREAHVHEMRVEPPYGMRCVTCGMFADAIAAQQVQADAARYQWLREQHWNESDMAVVCDPKKSVKLGYDCPSGERLDEAIDAAMKRSGGQQSEDVK